MSFIEILLIGVGLSMDAFAVSVCQGLSMTKIRWGHALTVGLYFGGFQALMPFIGWMLGSQFAARIQSFDHWVAFILLMLIGGNMLREALSGEEDEAEDAAIGAGLDHKKLFLMAIATSIDALAVGLSFSLLNINVWGPSTLIGVVCAVITALGLLAGKGLAHADIFGRRAELVGGCVLIGIGLKILYEHGVLS